MNCFEEGLLRYFSPADLQRIQCFSVGIAGAGGIGSNCAAMLVRCGFKQLTIVDFDEVAPSNLNRQYYTLAQVGRSKVEVLAENLYQINPELNLSIHHCKINKENIQQLFHSCGALVEAFDQVAAKIMLIEGFGNTEKLLVAVSGIAGYGNTDRIRTRQLRKNFYVVGDFTTGIEDAAPFAPAVTIAAAKQADLILDYVMGKKE